MKHAVRALGWAINIFWIIIIAFIGTAIYSALDLRMSHGHPQVFSSSPLLTLSFPISVNNTSYYDISELNSTVRVLGYDSSFFAASTNFVSLIPHGSNIETAHNVSLNLNDVVERTPGYLFNDTIFNVNKFLSIRYAYAFAFEFSDNTTVDWGAPLHNFSAGQISYQPYNSTHQKAIMSLGFENHSSFFSLNGTISLELYNDTDNRIGSGTLSVDVPRRSVYEGQIEAVVDSSRQTESGTLHFHFETSMFGFGPLVISYG